MQCYGNCSSCCYGDGVRKRFIVECSENRRRASPMKINNYTRVALRICCRARPRQARAPGQAGVCPLELHRRRPRARLSTARAVSAAVVRVRPPGNRAPSGQIDSESSGDDGIRIAMADTSNNTTSRSLWSSVQSTLYFTALHFTNDKFTLCTKPQRSILERMARFLQN